MKTIIFSAKQSDKLDLQLEGDSKELITLFLNILAVDPRLVGIFKAVVEKYLDNMTCDCKDCKEYQSYVNKSLERIKNEQL